LDNIKNNDLDYAANDAKDIAKIMKKLEGKIYNKVNLYTYADKTENIPSLANIVDALYSLQKNASADDTVMIFLAGHGESLNKNQYIFITKDAEQYGSGEYKMSTVLKWANVNDALKNLKCTKLLFLDTCRGGSVDILYLLKHELSLSTRDEQSKIILFTSTSQNQVAEECDQFSNGCFTYAIKKGLGEYLKDNNEKMPADDNNKDNKITFIELVNYVIKVLEKITAGQKPDISTPNGGINDIFYKR